MTRTAEAPTLGAVIVNLDKNRPNDGAYIARVMREARERSKALRIPYVVCFVETKTGDRNISMVGVRTRLAKRRMVKVGDVGVHNTVEVCRVKVGRRQIGRLRRKAWMVLGHGPHRRTIASREDPTGQRGQNNYYRALKEDVLDELDVVNFLGDLNNNPAAVAKIIGGTPFGIEDDVVGGTTRGMRVVRTWATKFGLHNGWGDHRECWVEFA